MSIFVLNMTTMIGLGVGIDYSLLVVTRFREELGRGLRRHGGGGEHDGDGGVGRDHLGAHGGGGVRRAAAARR